MADRRPARTAARLTRFDLVGRRTGARALVRQLMVALLTLAVYVVIRAILDEIAPGVGPFTPLYPLLIPATLLGRMVGGLLAWAISNLYVAVFIVPPVGALPTSGDDLALTILSVIASLFVVLLTEAARDQSAALLRERESRIAERDMLLEEVDHRLKNNLAMLSGLLSLQVRETSNEEAREVLARASARLQSLSQAYDNLRYEPGSVTVIDSSVLLENLCVSLRDALGLDGSIRLEAETVPALISRDRASALALLVNEVVTNAAKHAFTDRRAGTIRLRMARRGDAEAVLEISDDGRGMDPATANGGRGRKLLDALAEMAGGQLSVDSGAAGTVYRLNLRQLP